LREAKPTKATPASRPSRCPDGVAALRKQVMRRAEAMANQRQ
jgi:hypothetical protein